MQGYILNLLILVAISGILAASLDFIIGHGVIYSMAHAAFFGTRARV
jgi:ABC-type branched-subunit amino acid transport system permease subunit